MWCAVNSGHYSNRTQWVQGPCPWRGPGAAPAAPRWGPGAKPVAGQSTVWARLPPAPTPAPATAAGARKHRESADHRDPPRSCGIPGPSDAGRCRGGRLTARADKPAPDLGPCMIPQGLRPWTPPGTQSLDPLPTFRASLRRLELSQKLPALHTGSASSGGARTRMTVSRIIRPGMQGPCRWSSAATHRPTARTPP